MPVYPSSLFACNQNHPSPDYQEDFINKLQEIAINGQVFIGWGIFTHSKNMAHLYDPCLYLTVIPGHFWVVCFP